MVTTTLYTSEHLLQMSSDSSRFELVRGDLVEISPATGEQGKISAELHGAIWSFLKTSRLGQTYIAEFGFQIESDPDTILVPDVAFIRKSRLIGIRQIGFVPMSPDLAVEVESPSNREGEMLFKVGL